MTNKMKKTREQIIQTMHDRLAQGLDPLTGEKMETIGCISQTNGIFHDETGKEVTLNSRGTWIYVK